MKTILLSVALLVSLTLTASAPAMAASGQTKQDSSLSRETNYWLSRDLQKLVFWQAREHGSQPAAPRS